MMRFLPPLTMFCFIYIDKLMLELYNTITIFHQTEKAKNGCKMANATAS